LGADGSPFLGRPKCPQVLDRLQPFDQRTLFFCVHHCKAALFHGYALN